MKKLPALLRVTFMFYLVMACASSRSARADVAALSDYQLPRLPSGSWSVQASSSALAAALVVDRRDPDMVLRIRQRIARHILAAGAGLVLSAAITPLYVMSKRNPCYASERAAGRVPLTGAAVVGGLGVTMTVGGATWLGLQTRRHGSYARRRERLIAMAVGALAFALGQTLQGSLFFLDQICHS